MRLSLTVALACAALGLLAPGASASSAVRFGVQDDAWLRYGPGTLDQRLDTLKRFGVDVVRLNLHWNELEATRGQPDWGPSDAILQGLRKRKVGAVVGLVGSPRWANGGKASNFVPRAALFARFARTAAERYPWVRDWLIWNEPNKRRWLRPTSAAVYVKSLLNPAYKAIHAVNRRARVGGGVTAPRAGEGGVSPVAWIRGMKRARAKLDAYAHHPYPSRPTDTPFSGGCTFAGCTTITMATLERLLGETSRAFGSKTRIWLTEYGYQTGSYGVTQQRQAELIGEVALRVRRAPRVDLLIHYLVHDEPEAARFQSGLFDHAGAPKLAASAFPLPFTQAGRSGRKAVFWGQIRARSGRQAYRVQVRRVGGSWRWATGTRRTTARGFFSIGVAATRGTSVRLWSPGDRAFSVALMVD